MYQVGIQTNLLTFEKYTIAPGTRIGRTIEIPTNNIIFIGIL